MATIAEIKARSTTTISFPGKTGAVIVSPSITLRCISDQTIIKGSTMASVKPGDIVHAIGLHEATETSPLKKSYYGGR